MVVSPTAVVPSPKFHEYEAIDPSGSVESLASKETVSGATPDCGEAVNDGVGVWLAGSVTTKVVTAKVLLCAP